MITNKELLEILNYVAIYTTAPDDTTPGFYKVVIFTEGTDVYVPQGGDWFRGVIVGTSGDNAQVDSVTDHSEHDPYHTTDMQILKANVVKKEVADLAANLLRLVRVKNPTSSLQENVKELFATYDPMTASSRFDLEEDILLWRMHKTFTTTCCN